MSLIRSLCMYAAPIWFLITSSFLIQKLRSIQNSAFYIATGCVRLTSIDHLYEQTKMLPVQYHIFLISSQYLTKALQPNNPSHSVVLHPRVSETSNKHFNPGFYIVLLRIYREVLELGQFTDKYCFFVKI